MKDIHLKQTNSKQDYRRIKKYKVFGVSGIEKIIQPLKQANDPNIHSIATNEELFEIFYDKYVK